MASPTPTSKSHTTLPKRGQRSGAGLSFPANAAEYTGDVSLQMHRALAFVLVAVFAAGPALNLRCLIVCAPKAPAAEPVESCHQSSDSTAVAPASTHCPNPAAAFPALGAKRIELTLLSALTLDVSTLLPSARTSVDVGASSVPTASPPGPPLLIPLRI